MVFRKEREREKKTNWHRLKEFDDAEQIEIDKKNYHTNVLKTRKRHQTDAFMK